MGHSVTHSGIKEGKVQLTYIFRCILKEHSSAGWRAEWCGKRIRASESEALSQFQISPLKLTPVTIWSKSFSTGSAITLPATHPGGGASSSPNDRRMQLAISGWGYRCQMSCKAQESPVQQRIVPPKMPTVSTPKNPIIFSVLNCQNSDKHTNLPG